MTTLGEPVRDESSSATPTPPQSTTTTTTTTTTIPSITPAINSISAKPPARLSPASLFGVSRDAVLRASDDECRKQLQSSLRDALSHEERMRSRGQLTVERQNARVWLCRDQNVALRIQSGPSCGLVALQLSIEHLLQARTDADVDALLRCAVQRKCSKLGEMFIAAELAAVANEVYSGRLGSLSVRLLALDELPDADARVSAIVRHLRHGALALIAYDADKDNTPAQLGGSRAHWAVIKGFVKPTNDGESAAEVEQILFDKDDDDDSDDNFRAADVFFTCVHSKSKRAALWRADALLQSSAQLTTPDNTRNTDNQYVMPQNLQECLALKLILIENTGER